VHNRPNHGHTVVYVAYMEFFLILRICLSESFTEYTVTITQVQESVSDYNPESESNFLNPVVRIKVGVPQKMRNLHPW